jgi:hypothetical protein
MSLKRGSYKRHRNGDGLKLSLHFIANADMRVLHQKQLVARLKRKGEPTEQAEAALKGFERTLLQLQHHLEIMRELMKPGGIEPGRFIS